MSTAQNTQESPNKLYAKQLLRTLVAVKKGDFSVRMPIDQIGLGGKIADTLNDIIELNQRMAAELDRISTVVGKEGKISQRATIGNAEGSWSASVDSVNTLITDLVQPTSETARVIRAVAKGDLSQTIALEIEDRPLKGEFLQTAQIVNTMVDQLSSFASEVTRVAREVGTEGKLGVQAQVEGVAGTWKDLTDSVNSMAGNLTAQVRNIAEVTTAVANGDLSKKITVDVKGEILELKNTINIMVDQLSSFASEVTRVAREVGTEGKLGVQAQVQGVAGTWKDLTDSVNSMAGNLTAQVRNIAEVTTAVANGDLSKKITVDVKGEILELKNTINIMVDQLNSFASENNPGQGAKFTVSLPVVELNGQEAGLGLFDLPDAADPPPHLVNLQLLVVDDDDDSREFLIALLEDEGAMVRSATSVPEALATLETFWPDVLLSDIGMPGADGYQLIARVREMEAIGGGNMPAIALTAYAREEERQQALKAGFQMHLSKPVEINQLIDGIVNLAGRLGNNAVERHSAVETAFLTPNPLPIIEKNIKLV
ncbi:MAG: HAMP domain-containing protein [Microcoleus anatoxicus]|uniref:HAMP domain-containing protein n=1 Tax=Microcoleus anatoxicus TaxID=2705319 RepID=UPI003671DD62